MRCRRSLLAAFALLAVALLAAATPAAAAPEAPGPVAAMSLREAIAYARVHQPSLAAARARVEVARAQAELPAAENSIVLGGQAELVGGTTNNSTASYGSLGLLDLPRIGGTPANAPVSWRPEPTTLVGLAAHRQIYDFGRTAAQSDALEALSRAASENARAAQLDLELAVEDSFYAVLGAKAVVTASQAAVARAREHRDFAQARVGAQLMPPIELTRADADLARYEVDRIRAEGSLAVAQAELAAAIGYDHAQVDAGSDDLALPEAPAAAAGMADARARAPELRVAASLLSSQQAQTRAIEAELHPDVFAAASITGRAGGASVASNPSPAGGGWLPDVPNWDAMIVLSWPLRDRTIDVRAKASQRQEAVRAAELAQVGEQIRAAAERDYVQLDVARAALPALQRAVDAAQANHEQAEARFNGGLGTAVELSDAEAVWIDAQIQLAVGQFNLSRARALLARVLAESMP